jgi:hypothetical protein
MDKISLTEDEDLKKADEDDAKKIFHEKNLILIEQQVNKILFYF